MYLENLLIRLICSLRSSCLRNLSRALANVPYTQRRLVRRGTAGGDDVLQPPPPGGGGGTPPPLLDPPLLSIDVQRVTPKKEQAPYLLLLYTSSSLDARGVAFIDMYPLGGVHCKRIPTDLGTFMETGILRTQICLRNLDSTEAAIVDGYPL